jgi:thymidylate kinase
MLIVTFSGIDGAGKSTQLAQTAAFLRKQGAKVRVLVTLYCSMTGMYALYRERRDARKRVAATAPSPPASRIRTYPGGRSFDEDRNTRGVRLRRLLAYPIDCFVCSSALMWFRLRGYDVVLCDRYIFDKLVCLANPTGWFARFLVRLVPKPDVGILLAANPIEAEQRKPEHEMDYFESKAQAYRDVQDAGMGLTMVPADTIEQTQQRVRSMILGRMDASSADPSFPRTQESSLRT